MNTPYTATDLLKVIQYNIPEEEIERRLNAKAGWVNEDPVPARPSSRASRFANFLGSLAGIGFGRQVAG
jgi:hypothetical protein